MKNIKNIFHSNSIPKTITFCVLTFGIYVIYQLFTLTRIVNENVVNPIPQWFSISAITIHLISYFSLIIFFVASGSQELLIFSKAMHVISSIFHITWLIKVRNRINQIIGAKKGGDLWLNPILSSFLHVIYIQHKINQFLHKPISANSHTGNV
ncbi:DUF4234 domain-containing protein [Shewanella woodyi]|nr:DUF4234 domain-containing protein [Shewanella woodyi]